MFILKRQLPAGHQALGVFKAVNSLGLKSYQVSDLFLLQAPSNSTDIEPKPGAHLCLTPSLTVSPTITRSHCSHIHTGATGPGQLLSTLTTSSHLGWPQPFTCTEEIGSSWVRSSQSVHLKGLVYHFLFKTYKSLCAQVGYHSESLPGARDLVWSGPKLPLLSVRYALVTPVFFQFQQRSFPSQGLCTCYYLARYEVRAASANYNFNCWVTEVIFETKRVSRPCCYTVS